MTLEVSEAQKQFKISKFEKEIEKYFNLFSSSFQNEKNRETYKKELIFADCTSVHQNKPFKEKAEVFWHSGGFTLEELCNFDLTLTKCKDDESCTACPDNCNTIWLEIPMSPERYPCLYRTMHVTKIAEILKLCKTGDTRIQEWQETFDQRNGRTIMLYKIRFIENDFQYLIILQDNLRTGFNKKYKYELRTAFPLFDLDERRKNDRLFKKYG